MTVSLGATGRAYRINEYLHDLLEVQGKKVDYNDMRVMLNNTRDSYVAIKAPIMAKLVSQDGLISTHIKDPKVSQQVREWIKSLQNWDFDFSTDSIDATIYLLWEYHFKYQLFNQQIEDDRLRLHSDRFSGYEHFLINTIRHLEKDNTYLSEYCNHKGENFENACVVNLVRALEMTYNYLSDSSGYYDPESARYGLHHTVEYSHSPFSSTALRFLFHRNHEDNGFKNSINVGPIFSANFVEKGLSSYQTPAYRMIVDFGDEDGNLYSIDTGNNENILNGKYYFNLNQQHFEVDLRPMEFDRLDRSHGNRATTMRFIYRKWFDERREELARIEAEKANKENKKTDDL